MDFLLFKNFNFVIAALNSFGTQVLFFLECFVPVRQKNVSFTFFYRKNEVCNYAAPVDFYQFLPFTFVLRQLPTNDFDRYFKNVTV